MKNLYNFELKDIVNIDQYYFFLETYLKNNHILKKELFERTGICPNSYRNFWKNKEKNKYAYYSIISEEFNLKLPTEKELKELSLIFSKIVEDILYDRTYQLEEDNAIIEKIRYRNNKEHKNRISSLEGLLFEILYLILNGLLGKLSIKQQLQMMKSKMKQMEGYEFLITGEYLVLFRLARIYYLALSKQNFNDELAEFKDLELKYSFLQPLADKIIADAYSLCHDFSNAVFYGLKAYDGFIKTSNFKRAVAMKFELVRGYLITGSYLNAYQNIYELYLSYHEMNKVQQSKINKMLFESLIALKQYEEAYEFATSNTEVWSKLEGQIEYLMILCKLRKKEEFEKLYQKIKEAGLDKDSAYIAEKIQGQLKKGKLKDLPKLKNAITKSENPVFIRLCRLFFNLCF